MDAGRSRGGGVTCAVPLYRCDRVLKEKTHFCLSLNGKKKLAVNMHTGIEKFLLTRISHIYFTGKILDFLLYANVFVVNTDWFPQTTVIRSVWEILNQQVSVFYSLENLYIAWRTETFIGYLKSLFHVLEGVRHASSYSIFGSVSIVLLTTLFSEFWKRQVWIHGDGRL